MLCARVIINSNYEQEEARQTFVDQRLTQRKDFFKPIKRLKLKTMAGVSKVLKIRSARQNKEVEYRQHSNVALQLLFHAQNTKNSVPLEEALKYPLTSVPPSLGNADGTFAKTDKAKGMNYILQGTYSQPFETENMTDTLIIEDGNAFIHSIISVPNMFNLICQTILKRRPKKTDIIFSTDMYKKISTKQKERQKRGHGPAHRIQGKKNKET